MLLLLSCYWYWWPFTMGRQAYSFHEIGHAVWLQVAIAWLCTLQTWVNQQQSLGATPLILALYSTYFLGMCFVPTWVLTHLNNYIAVVSYIYVHFITSVIFRKDVRPIWFTAGLSVLNLIPTWEVPVYMNHNKIIQNHLDNCKFLVWHHVYRDWGK